MLIIESTPSVPGEFPVAPAILVQQPERDPPEPPKWKGKEKAVVGDKGTEAEPAGSSKNEITVDWTKYEPPTGLLDPSGFESDMVMQAILDSIEKVKARIVEEEERRKAEKEAERIRKEEELRKETEKANGTEASNAADGNPGKGDATPLAPAGQSQEANGRLTPEPVIKSKKQALKNLFRRLNHAVENGESSAAGAARHKRDGSSTSLEMNGHAAKKRLVSEVLRKKITKSSPSSSVHEAEVECVSCLDDFNPKEMVKAPCHSYCKPCFTRLIATTCENEQQWPPKCCLNTIPSKTIILNIDKDLKKTYHRRKAEWDLPISERIYCSSPSCSIWLRPYEINRSRNVARCSEGHWTCTICRGPQHEGDNCPRDRDLLRTDELAEEEGWKRCYGCHAYVEHSEACQHMTCRCGAEFCYVCGARWRTCGCTMEQLAAVKQRAETRRQERRDREIQEETELQEALRLIEEFEREEALKAELLRQEQERLAEERRQRLLEERIRREGERRRAVGIKYQELRGCFWNIHERQRIVVHRDHSTEGIDIEKKGAEALAELQEKQKADREKLNAVTKAKLTKREETLKREYAARVIEERRIEEEYHAQLKEYWSRKKDGEAQMEAAMKELKRKMDAGFKKWEKWRDNELENYHWSVKEEQGIKEEIMQEVERRLVEHTREEQNAFYQKRAAELRWVDIVIEERGRLLNDMEMDELENGENIDAWFDEADLDDVASIIIPEEFHDALSENVWA
ncbi:hypothetical protein F5Y04DRAFT_276454 [Hypomontagnella monticulosa]|nr:hypothetical protein F5Y04DRAFT_276454 [Hypomontagnella monticulosa]